MKLKLSCVTSKCLTCNKILCQTQATTAIHHPFLNRDWLDTCVDTRYFVVGGDTSAAKEGESVP